MEVDLSKELTAPRPTKIASAEQIQPPIQVQNTCVNYHLEACNLLVENSHGNMILVLIFKT